MKIIIKIPKEDFPLFEKLFSESLYKGFSTNGIMQVVNDAYFKYKSYPARKKYIQKILSQGK